MTPEQKKLWIDTLIEVITGEIGVREEGGPNKGERVEQYQKAVDNRADGEPWCMDLVQWAVNETMMRLNLAPVDFKRTEHCMTFFNAMKAHCDMIPQRGDIGLMRNGAGPKGHACIVITPKPLHVDTVEGNTNQAGSREGDGVYAKTRKIKGDPAGLHFVGFFHWDKIELMFC